MKKQKSIFSNLKMLNDSKFFAGIIILTMNIGSKYIVVELSRTQESFLKYTLGRLLLIFSILWIGTRDIVISLLLTAVFVLLVDYLFNENSRYCIIPEKYKELREELGATVKKLTLVGELTADWHPEWTENDPKRIQRYN